MESFGMTSILKLIQIEKSWMYKTIISSFLFKNYMKINCFMDKIEFTAIKN